MSSKIDRLNNMFVEEISKIIHNDVKDKAVNIENFIEQKMESIKINFEMTIFNSPTSSP